MEKKKLTKRQEQIFNYICDQTAIKGYPPSVREIADAIGLSSPSTVHTHMRVLESKGYLKRDSSKPRALEIKEERTRPITEDDPGILRTVGTVTLPLVGRVAAGVPTLAEQNIEVMMPLPASIVPDSASFVLRVRGESMVMAGIRDGDYVVVKEQSDATNGQIVVAMIEDGATVKTFYREKEFVRLQPENPIMEAIYVKNPRILGRVVALFRTM